MANLAVPDEKFPSNSDYISGSMGPYIGGACIARSTDGGKNFSIYQCVHNNHHFYDGGSLAVTNDGKVFFATMDVDTGRYDVWKASTVNGSFSKVSDPFPGVSAMTMHPRLAAYENDVYILGQQYGGALWINRSSGSGWQSPKAASYYIPATQGVQLSDRSVRFGPQYSLALGPATALGNDEVRIVYTAWSGSKHFLAASVCPRTLPGCYHAPEWNTLNEEGDQFHPSVDMFLGFLWFPSKAVVGYFSRKGDPSGNQVRLRRGGLYVDTYNNRYFSSVNVTPLQTVCPSLGGYWGDYHAIKYMDLDQNQNPLFVATFSDSSAGCDRRWSWMAHHLHVSSEVFY
jgi:hypothetical protein